MGKKVTATEKRAEAIRLIELARALLTGTDTEMAGLLLDQAVEVLTSSTR